MSKVIEYTDELANEICDLMAGGMSLKAITTLENMPCRTTIWKWSCTHSDFRNNLSRAREAHADTLADEVVDIADTEVDPQRARNMIEARKWKAGVIKPRQYGPRLGLEVEGTINLEEARAKALERVGRPVIDQQSVPVLQPIEVIEEIDANTSDKQSDAEAAASDPDGIFE